MLVVGQDGVALRRRGSCCTRRRAAPRTTGRFCSSGAVRKCSSMAWAPASSSSKWSKPTCERDRQADRRPQRVAAADPVPEAEHVGGVDAERGDRLGVGREGDEVAWRRPPSLPSFASSQARAEPALVIVSWVVKVLEATMNRVRAGSRPAQRLAPGACRRRWRRSARRRSARGVGLERLADHHRAEVGAADADVDDVGDRACRCGRASAPVRTALGERRASAPARR